MNQLDYFVQVGEVERLIRADGYLETMGDEPVTAHHRQGPFDALGDRTQVAIRD